MSKGQLQIYFCAAEPSAVDSVSKNETKKKTANVSSFYN